MIEVSNHESRNRQLSQTLANAKPCGRFSAEEVRALSRENATMRMSPLADLRQLGCPDKLYERILEGRAKKLGFEQAVVPESGSQINAADLF